MKHIELHRFHDRIAVSIPGASETIYLTSGEAQSLANALTVGARDVRATRFTDSTYPTVTVELVNEGKR